MVFGGVVVLHRLQEPLVERGGGVPGFVFGGEQFGQLPEIGKAAFVALPQQARFDAVLCGKGGEGSKNALPLPGFAGGCGGCGVFGQTRFAAVQLGDLRGGVAEQHAAEHEAQQAGALRFEPEGQQGGEGLGFDAFENGFALYGNGGDAACGQGAFDELPFLVAVDEDSDVAGLHGGAAVFQTALCARVDEGGGFVGAVVGGALAQEGFVGRVFAFLVQPADVEGGLRRAEAAVGAVGFDLGIADAFEHEGTFFLCEQARRRLGQAAVATEVARQRVVLRRVGGGLQVGVDVGTAKGVNRLFGVADEKQRPPPLDKDAAEDFVLQRVGVLEFVDEGDRPVVRHGVGQRFGVCACGEGVVDVEQQLVGAAAGARAAFFGGAFAHVLQKVQLQGDQRLMFGGQQVFCGLVGAVQQGEVGKVGGGGVLPFFDGGFEVFGGENADAFGISQQLHQFFRRHLFAFGQRGQLGEFDFILVFVEFAAA